MGLGEDQGGRPRSRAWKFGAVILDLRPGTNLTMITGTAARYAARRRSHQLGTTSMMSYKDAVTSIVLCQQEGGAEAL
jgi:hypothetical protein